MLAKRPDNSQNQKPFHNINPIALFCLLAVGSLLALSIINSKIAISEGAEPLLFLFATFLGSGIVLSAVVVMSKKKRALNWHTLEYGFIAGALFAIPNVMGYSAVIYVGAGFLSLTFVFPILLTYIIALFIRLERLSMRRSLAIISGLAGGTILTYSKASIGDSELLWIALAMMAPLFIAIGNIYRTVRWPPGVSSLFLAALMLLGGSIVLLPFVVLSAPSELLQLVDTWQSQRLLVIQIGIFSVLNVLLFVLQKLAGPVYLAQIGSVGAVVGILLAVGLLGETAPPNLWLAGILIGIALILFHQTRR